MVLPVMVIALAVPAFLSAKVPAAVPPTVTTSLPIGATTAVPPSVSATVASYTRFAAVKPATLRFALLMLAVVVALVFTRL